MTDAQMMADQTTVARKCCIFPGCEKPRHGSGYCNTHYRRLQRHGDPSIVTVTPSGLSLDWLEKHIHFDGDQCLIFPFCRYKNGYAQLGTFKGNTERYAHRWMLKRTVGDPPEGKPFALHSCGKGNTGCVNPKHLYWGDDFDNQADKLKHGTSNRGERHGMSKLTNDQVRVIRSLFDTHTCIQLAEMFGVSKRTISSIRQGVRWNHIT